MAAQVTDTEEDLHAVTRVVLALTGADDDLTGDAANAALADAGIGPDTRRLLMAALGPPPGRPTVTELRRGLEAAAAALSEPRAEAGGLARLFRELHGRRVTRTALWYVGASVAIVEATNLFVPMLGAPPDVVRLLAIAAFCGLPVALVLAWTFDVAPAMHTAVPRWLRLGLITGVALLSFAAAAAIWRGGSSGGSARAASPPEVVADPAHVAIGTFAAIGGDNDIATFADQLQVRLIDGLSAAAPSGSTPGQLRVLSLAGVLPFTRGEVMVDSLRDARGVGTLLHGSVEQVGEVIRVRIRLIDTRSGNQIHTARIDALDRVTLLGAVADSVADLIRETLGPVMRQRMRLLETRSPAAFDRLVWAKQRAADFDLAFDRSDYSSAHDMLNDADSALVAAERLDPRWIEPILDRARLDKRRARIAHVLRDTAATIAAIGNGIAHVERALAIAPEDSRALELRGDLVQHRLLLAAPVTEQENRRLLAMAERDLLESLVGSHAPAGALRMLSELAGSDGRMQEAVQYGRRAYASDPFMEQARFTVFRLFEYSFALRDDAGAAQWCAEGRRRFVAPIFDDCRLALAAWSDHPLGADSLWILVESELHGQPAPLRALLEPRLHAVAAAVLVRAGLADSARAVLHGARVRDTTAGTLRAAVGAFMLLGEPDSAATVIAELMRRHPAEARRLRDLPELRPAWNEPRLRDVLETAVRSAEPRP